MTFKLKLASLSVVGLCFGCNNAELRPAQYPPGVPSYAVWAGGADGGAYISCTNPLPRGVNFCRVWNDFTGEIGGVGDYQLQSEHRAATPDELKYTGAAVPYIYLRGWLILQRKAQ